MNKRGLSPVIASVLLIMIVIILASIVFLWARGFVKEGVSKFGEPAENACAGKVKFQAGIFPSGGDYVLEINNQGEAPLYGFDIKRFGKGEVVVTEYTSESVRTGESITLSKKLPGSDFDDNDEILVVPIILGETDAGKVAYTCADQYGVGVTI